MCDLEFNQNRSSHCKHARLDCRQHGKRECGISKAKTCKPCVVLEPIPIYFRHKKKLICYTDTNALKVVSLIVYEIPAPKSKFEFH